MPCHIAGARNAEEIDKELKEKVVFHLGLVCNHTPTFHATEFIINKYDMYSDEIDDIKYRGGGWPGGMRITSKQGECIYLSQFHPDYWGAVFNTFFVPKRCGLCDDKECRNSDAAFADAWIPEIMSKDRIGSSIIVSRATMITDLLNKAEIENVITLREVHGDTFSRSQSLLQVKRRAYARINLLSTFGRKTPFWNSNAPRCTCLDYVTALMFILRNYYLSKPSFYSIIRMYSSLYNKASQFKRGYIK